VFVSPHFGTETRLTPGAPKVGPDSVHADVTQVRIGPVLTPEDLLAAKILYSKRPDLRSVLSAGVDTLMEDDSEKGLLASLVVRDVIPREEAYWIHERVEHYKRTWALGFYSARLVERGVDETLIQEAIAELGPTAEPNTLGSALVAAEEVDADVHKTLAFEARQAFDKHLAEHVSSYRGKREVPDPESAPSGEVGSWTDTLPAVGSGVYRLEDQVEEVSAEVSALPPTPVPAGPPPEFDVPEWVDTADERAGDEVGGYRIIGRIGKGAMGVVYLVDHPQTPAQPVAIKILLGEISEETRGRFKREILVTSLFDHDASLLVYGSGDTDDGRPFLAMEFFDGAELGGMIESQSLEPEQAISLAIQLFGALDAAHVAGVVHRDIKPENILVSWDGELTKLMDFGIATLPGVDEVEGEKIFKTMLSGEDTVQLVPGTPRYMSPEQASYQDAVGPASDNYSLGIVLYEMLSGRVPFEAETTHGYLRGHVVEKPLPLAEISPELAELPRRLHSLLAQLLDKSPSKRPTPSEAIATLERVLDQMAGLEVDIEPTPDATPAAPTGKLIGKPSGTLIGKKKKAPKKKGLFGLFGKRRG
jgi:hypothetical protein